MSINSALAAGVTGLSAYSSSLASISDNIANVNTVGYKRSVSGFSSLVTSNGSATSFSAGGVEANLKSIVSQGGLLQASSSPTDLAISGEGFFVVAPQLSTNPELEPFLFTRAGSFTQDENGFLRNSAGLYLQGWPIDADGNVPANPSDLSNLEAVNVNQLGGTAEATTTATINANLNTSIPVSPAEATYDPDTSNMASGTVTSDFTHSVRVFDSKGGFRTLTFSYLRSSTPNQWHTEVYVQPASDIVSSFPDSQVARGTLAFQPNGIIDLTNTSTSLLSLDFAASGTGAPGAGQFKWADDLGIEAQALSLNLGNGTSPSGITQFEGDTAVLSTQVNGAVFGGLSGVSVDDEGFVTAVFENGITRQVYQIPLATFVNPDGLRVNTGNAYSVTIDSGAFTLERPGSGTSGTISPAALESSTVDLAKEFTDLITTQRAYSASTRVITTSDQMLEELIRLKQ